MLMDGPSPFSDILMRKNRVLGEQVRFENHEEVDGAHDSRYRPVLCKSAGKKDRRQYGGLISTYGLRDLPEPGFTLGMDQSGGGSPGPNYPFPLDLFNNMDGSTLSFSSFIIYLHKLK